MSTISNIQVTVKEKQEHDAHDDFDDHGDLGVDEPEVPTSSLISTLSIPTASWTELARPPKRSRSFKGE